MRPFLSVPFLFGITLLIACTSEDYSGKTSAAEGDWPKDLAPPISNATFSITANHLPGAPRQYRAGVHQGFDFFNGFSGRILPPETAVVAVATGEVIRIDQDYAEPSAETLGYWASLADAPGAVGAFALDQLRGRQVWIRHQDGHVSRYAHLSAVDPGLTPGDSVEQGQAIGLMGNSGVPPTEDQPDPAPHLHFELWSPDGLRYLGQGASPLEAHRQVARTFGPDALPRYARQVVEDIESGASSPESYPPDPLPEAGFTAEPPNETVTGQAFAVPVTWESDDFRVEDFFAIFEGIALGVIDAGDGIWILGAAPLEFAGQEAQLVIGAVDPYGQPLMGQRTLAIAPSSDETPAPMEISPQTLDLYTEENRRRERERLRAATLASLQRKEALWDNPFQAPLEGNVVAAFGQRLVTGPLAPQFPRPGLLIQPADESDKVLASNAGTVVVSEELPIRGRTVAIEHGGGVISVYAHLDSFQVEPGQRVSRGQVIGTVGQTGAIDRELLRWEIHVAGIPTNPRHWLDKVLPGR